MVIWLCARSVIDASVLLRGQWPSLPRLLTWKGWNLSHKLPNCITKWDMLSCKCWKAVIAVGAWEWVWLPWQHCLKAEWIAGLVIPRHNQIELSIGSSVLVRYIHLQFIHTIPSIESLSPPHPRCGSCCAIRALSSHMIFNQSDFCLRSHDSAVSTILCVSACTISKVYGSCYKLLTSTAQVEQSSWRRLKVRC